MEPMYYIGLGECYTDGITFSLLIIRRTGQGICAGVSWIQLRLGWPLFAEELFL